MASDHTTLIAIGNWIYGASQDMAGGIVAYLIGVTMERRKNKKFLKEHGIEEE